VKRTFLASLGVLAACAASRPSTPGAGPPPVSTGGSGRSQPIAARTVQPIDEQRAPDMPTCEASDLVSLGTLTAGLAAQAVIARNDGGGVVLYLVDANHDGDPELTLQRLDAEGQPAGSASALQTGARPAYPTIVAQGTGYAVAWREGLPGHERLAARMLDANGAPMSQAIATSAFSNGWLGAPTAAIVGNDLVLAVATQAERPADPDRRSARTMELLRVGGERITFSAPDPNSFDATQPPLVLAGVDGAPRIFALVLGDAQTGRSLVELRATEPRIVPVARDIDAASVLHSADGAFFGWRARVGLHDVALRSWFVPADGASWSAPVTLATMRGAFDARVVFAPIAENRVGAFTISRLADDASGSLNVSVLGANGDYVGRQPAVISLLVRDARPAAAARAGSVWFVVDARGDAGSGPVLALTRVTCDSAHAADRRQIPAPAMVQLLSSDEPRADLASLPANLRATCTPAGTATVFARHHSGVPYALGGSAVGVVTAGDVTTALAVVHPPNAATSQLVASSVDAHGVAAPARMLVDSASALLATGVAGTNAIAIVRVGTAEAERGAVVSVRGAGRPTVVSVPVARPTSAVVAQETGAIVVVGESLANAGDVTLFFAPNAARAAAPTAVALLAPGDRVLDALHDGSETLVLLARPDRLGEEVSRQLAIVSIPDGSRGAVRGDAFADAIGHGRGEARLVRAGSGPAIVYHERNVLRWAEIEHRELRNLRSLLATNGSGGAIFGRPAGTTDARWVAMATGMPEDAARRVTPITLVALSARGEMRGVTTAFPDDPNAINEGVALGVDSRRMTVVYARTERDGDAAWMIAQTACTLPAQAAAPASPSPARPAGGAR